MKYAVVYTGCMIVESDSEGEAEEAFYEENIIHETEKFVLAQPCYPCYRDMYEVADDLADSAASVIIG